MFKPITTYQQRMLVHIYERGRTTRHEQGLYNKIFFYDIIKRLIKNGFVDHTMNHDGPRAISVYTLTVKGIELAKMLKEVEF